MLAYSTRIIGRRGDRRAWIITFLWICVLFLAAGSAPALEVLQARWGFDGRAVPDRFNLLSVLVSNPTGTPFDGTLDVYKRRGPEYRIGAIYSAPCYVSPGMTRWVQFYLYVDNRYDQWRVQWGPAPGQRYDLDAPRQGPPAQVILSDAESSTSAGSAFKEFPEALFPPTVAATDGLGSLLLDHAPRWESSRRKAFMDWLRAGGTVHLLLGADGRYPVFAGELSPLNSPAERTRIGAGLVVRHAVNRRAIRIADLTTPGAAAPGKSDKKPGYQGGHQMADSFLRALATLNRLRRSWGWIYTLTLAYVVIIGPGILLAGRRLGDYRVRIAVMLATVAGFAWLFNAVGRRGQGESGVVHTLSCARAIDQDTYNVTQWIDVFATHGADYTVAHAAPHNLYASGLDFEAVNGRILSGRQGRFLVDIPMFSRRALLHEAEMKGPRIPLKILDWEGKAKLDALTVAVGPDFAKQVLGAWVVRGNRFYRLKLKADRLELQGSTGHALDVLLTSVPELGYGIAHATRRESPVEDVESRFRKMAEPLIAWSLGDTKNFQNYLASAAATDGRVQLFIFARSPAGFSIIGPQFGREIGYTLYCFNLFRPGS